jgi:protein-tyrosine-phosphatase
MKKLGVEFVCTANGARSPMAETIGKARVRELGLEDCLTICSSGSHYQDLLTMDMPFSYLIANMRTGLERGFYEGGDYTNTKSIIEDGEKFERIFSENSATERLVKTLAKISEDRLAEEEERFRDVVLSEIGLEYTSTAKQYESREDIGLVLPMTAGNSSRVAELSKSGIQQKVVPLREYVGLDGEITNPFGQPLEVWRKARNDIDESVHLALDRAIGEILGR